MRLLRNSIFLIGALTLTVATSFAQDTSSRNEMNAPHLPDKDAAASAQDTTPTFSLTLKAGLRNEAMQEYRAGATVWITIIQTNLTTHAIDTSGARSGGINKEFLYEVLDEDGKPAEKVIHLHPDLDMNSPFWSAIPAGKSEIDEVQLNRLFKFDRPGKYVIQVGRRERVLKDAAGKPVIERSNSIIITIIG